MSPSIPSRKESILVLTGPGYPAGSPPYTLAWDKDVACNLLYPLSELTGLASHLLGLEAPA